VIARGGDHTLAFVNAAADGGDVIASVKLKAPKSARRTLRITGAAAPPGAGVVGASVIGKAGGLLESPADAPIGGASVSVPPGTLTSPTSVLLGVATTIAPADPTRPGGPSVSFWTEQARFTAPVHVGGERFGSSVAVSGDRVVIGAPRENANQGAAYVYRRSGSTWSGPTALPFSGFGQFGDAVAVEGGTIAVGAYFDAVGGKVFAFEDDGQAIAPLAALTPTDPASPQTQGNDQFGQTLAFRNGYLAVGAPLRALSSQGLLFAGQVFLFAKSATGFDLAARLRGTALDALPLGNSDNFGDALAFDGTTICVGATERDVNSFNNSGAVYVFTLGN